MKLGKMNKCITCGKDTEVCYTDSGILGLTHGWCQCHDCYLKAGHIECPNCKTLMLSEWIYCPKCGKPIK
jgi:hypothetical protein